VTTVAPSSLRRRALAAPIPDAPPVTTATLPISRSCIVPPDPARETECSATSVTVGATCTSVKGGQVARPVTLAATRDVDRERLLRAG